MHRSQSESARDHRKFLVAGAGLLAGATAAPTASVYAEEPKLPSASQPKAVADGDGEKVWAAGVTVNVKLRAEDSAGMYSMFGDLIPPGGGPPPHTHTKEDETIYVVEGELVANFGGKKFEAKELASTCHEA